MSNLKAKMFNKRAEKNATEIISNIDIKSGDTIADLGSGGGYYTYAFAKMVSPSGKVYAVDTDTSLLSYVKDTAAKKQLKNVDTIKAETDNPNLPEGSCDLVFSRNVFHHIADPATYFRQLSKSLKPDGRIAVIDWKPGATLFAHNTPPEQIYSTIHKAGYIEYKTFDFLEKQSFTIFKKAK